MHFYLAQESHPLYFVVLDSKFVENNFGECILTK